MPIVTRGVEEFNAAVKAHPRLLDNQHIYDVHLNARPVKPGNGVVLEDLVIRNLTLRDVQMRGALLKNVTFVDCKFIKADFSYSTFSNVKFIRGSMSGHAQPDSYEAYETTFKDVAIDRVLFDGVYIDKSVSTGFHGGIVVLRNVTTTQTPNRSARILGGGDIQIRVDNCKIFNQGLASLAGTNNSLYVTNSVLSNADMIMDATTAWVENCDVHGVVPAATTLVVKNNRVHDITVLGRRDTGCRAFLTGNTYTASPADQGATIRLFYTKNKTTLDTSYLYLYADAPLPCRVAVQAGNVHIYDTEIDDLALRHLSFETNATSLNLENVKIKHADWESADVRGGRWQNVEIYPPVDLKTARFDNILGHNVRFPQGTPWVNGVLNIAESPTPLKFDRPPVPTLEETGLAQFWKEHDFPEETY